uniref:Uncharacterized protein n=1 Tax=Arundo donax TaxID=35708 RepID=A0A0A8ZUQ7_ARUDO
MYYVYIYSGFIRSLGNIV